MGTKKFEAHFICEEVGIVSREQIFRYGTKTVIGQKVFLTISLISNGNTSKITNDAIREKALKLKIKAK